LFASADARGNVDDDSADVNLIRSRSEIEE
jgi:hypothetical protein